MSRRPLVYYYSDLCRVVKCFRADRVVRPKSPLPKGAFRAPARGTFAPGGKSTQKRRSNLRFENPLRAFACCLSCLPLPRERCSMQTSPKCCIVSASLFAAAFALKCRAIPLYASTQKINQRPLAATYLCRLAAKARFDNRPPHGVGVSKGEGSHRPKAIGKEDSVKETHQGFLSRSVGKSIFALQKS